MSELVKTGRDIRIAQELVDYETKHKLYDKKYLILPDGLDKLEEMLKEKLSGRYVENEISSTFARFKKENSIEEK
jgi:hypothetical protein